LGGTHATAWAGKKVNPDQRSVKHLKARLRSEQPVAFVTGASQGLGRALAIRLARDGYRVGLAARRRDLLDRVAEEISAAAGAARAFACDVGSREEVHAAVRACEAELGPVTLLVANAGVSEMTPVEPFDALNVERLLRVNFLGAVYAVEAALPGMTARRSGQLVAIGSLAGYGGLPLSGAYSASKAALHVFFESLRLDLRRRGIDVTVITPGYVDTQLTKKNLHRMPFLVPEHRAVERIVRAIHRRERLAAFPFPMSTLVRLGQIFPRGIYDAFASKLKREKRPEAQG
jgi:short-subunit dehydrogenase